MKITLIILLILNAILFGFSFDLPQENPQELFLSDVYHKELKRLQNDFENEDIIFVSNLTTETETSFFDFAEINGSEFASLKPLMPSEGVMTVPPMSDGQKFEFFTRFEKKFPELTFAGDSYTNAHLAGMSIKIQKILFPVIFVLIFIGLVFLTKNLVVSLYLFLSSLLGVGVGLSCIKIFYGHSTILTTITPLIAFVLTLGVQLHVVYGLSSFKSLEIFFQHKLRPLLIMMVTTLIGFLSLITSDLMSIRQLAMTSTVALALTWAILLILLKTIPLSISLERLDFLKNNLKMPRYRPLLGYGILTILLIGGSIGIIRMPILVDAIAFFPDGHEVHKGYVNITKSLGGTPQFEVIIKRNDQKELDFSDYQKIALFEEELTKGFPGYKLLTLNNLVKFANNKYASLDGLPDNHFAYLALSSRIPSSLQKFQVSPTSYRISLVSPVLDTNKKDIFEEKLLSFILKLDPIYSARISGLNYLLLKSQSHLVQSLIKSFLTSFLMIVLVFAAFSRNMHDIIIFSILNFASILGGLFCMWMTGFSLNISSIMTVSISMGLVVDSTVHLLFVEKMKENDQIKFSSTLTPIILSHILLFFAFSFLSLEGFLPIRDFSLGLIILLFIGLLCDLFVLPLIAKKS